MPLRYCERTNKERDIAREKLKMCDNNVNGAQSVKRKRVLLTLQKKLEVLDYICNGESHLSAAKKFRLSESTVRTIKNAESSIRNSARYGCTVSNSIMYASRPLCIEMMETKLNAWYTQHTNKGIRLTNRQICDMAVTFLSEIKSPDDTTDFKASNSWLTNFKRRFDIQNAKVPTWANEYCDSVTFKEKFQKVIQLQGFLPEQVFHMGEDFLFWKRLPTTELKDFTEKIAMAIGCNASGDFISKPMIAYKSVEPPPCTDKLGLLPVFWRHNAFNCIAENDLEQWYTKCFIPNVSRYLVSKSLPPKILLLMENTKKNMKLLDIPIGEISVTMQMFPLKCRELQPLSIGIFPAFKRYYLRRMLSHLSQKIFFNPALKLLESWRAFDILNSIGIIKDSIDEISASDINACWRSLWPEIVHEYSTLPNEGAEIDEILQVVREINDPSCFHIQSADILIVLNSSNDLNQNVLVRDAEEQQSPPQCESGSNFVIELDDSNDFVVQNEAQYPTDGNYESDNKSMPRLVMPLENLNQIFSSALALERLVLKMDPSNNRSMKFSEQLQEILRPYREQKLNLLDNFQP